MLPGEIGWESEELKEYPPEPFVVVEYECPAVSFIATFAPGMGLLLWSRTLPETDVTVCGLSGPFTLTDWESLLELLGSLPIVALTVTVTVRVSPALTVGAFSVTVKSLPF